MARMQPYSQNCPVARTLDVIGDRWTLLIVRDMFMGKTRFGEFLASSKGLPPKVLSTRLKKLMEHGLVERNIYSEHPLRAEYRLTERGRSLLPIIKAIGQWGFDNMFEGEDELRDHVYEIVTTAIPELADSWASPREGDAWKPRSRSSPPASETISKS